MKKLDGVSIVSLADMWRKGDYVYMKLDGNEYMFRFGDILLLEDLGG